MKQQPPLQQQQWQWRRQQQQQLAGTPVLLAKHAVQLTADIVAVVALSSEIHGPPNEYY